MASLAVSRSLGFCQSQGRSTMQYALRANLPASSKSMLKDSRKSACASCDPHGLCVLTCDTLNKGAELKWIFFCFFSFLVGGCSPSFFHIFIGFAAVFIDFLAFVLFPLGFSLVFKFSAVFSMFI